MTLAAFLVAGATAQAQQTTEKDKTTAGKTAKPGQEATITKVDTKNKTVTVKMKDKTGKEVEKTFRLTEDIRYFDSTGRAARIDVFQAGNDVLVIEEEGRLREVHQKGKTGASNSNRNK
jgi:hypothetical protein